MIDILGAYIALAGGMVANKFVLRSMSPTLFVGIRMFVSGFLLFFISRYRASRNKTKRFCWRYIKADILTILFIATCTALIPALLKAYALPHMPASKYSLLGSIDPFVTAVYAYLLWREKLSWKKFLGIVIGFGGVVISLLSTSAQEMSCGEFWHISYPELFVIGSMIISRYGWILVQSMLRKERYAVTEVNSLTMLLSGGMALGISAWQGAWVNVSSQNSMQFMGALLFTIFVGNVIGYSWYADCLKRYSVTWMALAGLLIPLFVFFISYLLGDEPISIHFFVSLAVVCVGMLVFYFDDLTSHAHAKEQLPPQ